MEYQEICNKVQNIVADIFEKDPQSLGGRTRLMVDLPCESIDLLEIGARVGQEFRIPVDDDVVFLRSLRYHLSAGEDPEDVLLREYPYLPAPRRTELVRACSDPNSGPQLCLDDIAAYIRHNLH